MREAKQVLVVRKDLRMRKGKIAAQCAHASMKVLLDKMSNKESIYSVFAKQHIIRRTLLIGETSPFNNWLEGSFTKICVYVESETELEEIYQNAKNAGVDSSLIIDSGRTEFNNVPTKTVVAVGPGWNDEIDKVTGHLPLL